MPEDEGTTAAGRERARVTVERLAFSAGLKTKKSLAAAAGIDDGTVGDFLNGTRWPRADSRGEIEKVLGLTHGQILRWATADPQVPTPGAAPTLADATELDLVLTLLERIRNRPN